MRGRCDSREEDKRGEQPCVSEIGISSYVFSVWSMCSQAIL